MAIIEYVIAFQTALGCECRVQPDLWLHGSILGHSEIVHLILCDYTFAGWVAAGEVTHETLKSVRAKIFKNSVSAFTCLP